MRCASFNRSRPDAAVKSPIFVTSPLAQKALPLACSSTARTLGSRAACSNAVPNASRISTVSALRRSGLSTLLPEQRVRFSTRQGTKGVEDKKIADYIRANTFKTVLGDVKFGRDGEWALPRMLQIQFHDVKSNDVEQFRAMNTQTVVTPAEYKSGDVIYPYEKAK